MLSPHFEVNAALYFRVYDAEIYGGHGSVGYAMQKVQLLPDSVLSSFDDQVAGRMRTSMSDMLKVPPEKLEFITGEEYEQETEEVL